MPRTPKVWLVMAALAAMLSVGGLSSAVLAEFVRQSIVHGWSLEFTRVAGGEPKLGESCRGPVRVAGRCPQRESVKSAGKPQKIHVPRGTDVPSLIRGRKP